MGLDIRLPIGMMFTLVGLILVITGATSSDSATLQRSLGMNINLWWGIFLVIFGGLMLLFALIARKKDGNSQH
ncbi:hypothetical protein DB347_13215 [Opitutaceae bacterium EW11]|nr:hypothetical protein DB347_13215 [Opitutaceae bacterium EW11]